MLILILIPVCNFPNYEKLMGQTSIYHDKIYFYKKQKNHAKIYLKV